MEMGLCFYHQGSDHIDFAGANRPLWIYRAHTHDIEIIKPTKSGIAGGAEYDQFYEGHRIKVSKGDRVFMFSDGAPDQFGGEKGKKLTTRGFRDMLLRLQSEPIQEQKQRLIGFYEHWMQGHEQVDDILIIGFEIS
jgi:serine phosphatase RsbU (regulator of sigma subunit)